MSNSPPLKSLKSAKMVLFLTVFLDLVGFGIFITLSTYLAGHFQATPLQIGWLMSVYSIAQFIFAPLWGRISDRIGRRPVLLLSILGGSLSYLGLAFAPSLLWMFICRTLAGVFAANISTAHAYIADITSEKDRSSGMGLIGAAFGMGFIVGPALGSLFFYYGQKLGDQPPFGIFFPALMAFVITFANLIWAYFALPETVERKTHNESRFEWLHFSVTNKLLSNLILVFFTVNFAMPLMEVMLFPLVRDLFNWSFKEAGIGFAIVGVMMALTQGLLVRRVLPRWGERRVLVAGMLLLALSFYIISVAETLPLMAVAMTLLAVGNGLIRPSLLGMVSLLANKKDQGVAMGASQSAASLGRILGPVAGGWLYVAISKGSPFFAAGCVTLCGLFILIFNYKLLPDQKRG